jgi:pyrroloquinoline quinone biosynthesis protein B
VRVRILGSAAGGGFPQWNCGCDNCKSARSGILRGSARTQSSIAVSADGARWCLVNASPDLRAQVLSFAALAPPGGRRGTAIDAILLTDAEIDHVGGLLSLRETQALRLYCSAAVFAWVFESNPVFAALLQPGKLVWSPVTDRATHRIRAADERDTGLSFQAFFVRGKVPTYVRSAPALGEGATLAYRIVDDQSGSSILYVPAIREIDDDFLAALPAAACLLFDGSFWSDRELESSGVGTRTATSMGHLPIGGAEGSLERLRHLGRMRRIYTHVNNTNPILDQRSPHYAALVEAGWEVAEDGMDLDV